MHVKTFINLFRPDCIIIVIGQKFYLYTKPTLMKGKIIAFALFALVTISGCNKDLASDWAGTYNGSSGSNTVQRVVVTSVDKKAVKLELQTAVLGTYYTFATIANGKLTDATTVSVNEDGTIAGETDPYHFTGAGTLTGTTLTISGKAENKNNASDVKLYYFSGNR